MKLLRTLLSVIALPCLFVASAAADTPLIEPPSPDTENVGGAVEVGGLLSREACASAAKVRDQFKPIAEIQLVLKPQDKELPPDCATEVFVGRQPAIAHNSSTIEFNWEPTNFFHQPLYFDDVPLERYGQSVCPAIQPWISGARFVLTFPVMPYKMGFQHTHDCVSVLGYHRPGNSAPCVRETLPWDGEAALWQAASTVGLVFLLP